MAQTIIGIALIVMAVFLVIAVLMQHGKDHRLSGSIAGGAETFFGKEKGKTVDSIFSKLTSVITVIFVVLVVVLYVMQPEPKTVEAPQGGEGTEQTQLDGDKDTDNGENVTDNGENKQGDAADENNVENEQGDAADENNVENEQGGVADENNAENEQGGVADENNAENEQSDDDNSGNE